MGEVVFRNRHQVAMLRRLAASSPQQQPFSLRLFQNDGGKEQQKLHEA